MFCALCKQKVFRPFFYPELNCDYHSVRRRREIMVLLNKLMHFGNTVLID